LALCFALSLMVPAARAAAAGPLTLRPPLESAVSTAGASWVVLPMGNFSDPRNTFWEIFYEPPGASHWSLVTPPGVADNGGLVAGASAGSIVVGILPSQLLHFSPLAQSSDGGDNWSPVFFPTAVSHLPDALAYQATSAAGPDAAVALVGGRLALAAPAGLGSWTPLVSATRLAAAFPACGVTGLDAVALPASGPPVIGTGCARGGRVGLFTASGGAWRPSPVSLGGRLARSATAVLRLQVSASTTTALVAATRTGQSALVAMWRTTHGSWGASVPFPLGRGTRLLSSAVGPTGELALLTAPTRGPQIPLAIVPGGTWGRLPMPPPGTTALAAVDDPSAPSGTIDAFTVNGGDLGVFALSPSRTAWVRVQSSQIPLAYGSSS